MKTFVHFGSEGIIDAVVTLDAPDGVTAGLQTEAGQMVAELDSAELTSAEGNVEKLRAMIKEYKVTPSRSPLLKLTKVH